MMIIWKIYYKNVNYKQYGKIGKQPQEQKKKIKDLQLITSSKAVKIYNLLLRHENRRKAGRILNQNTKQTDNVI